MSGGISLCRLNTSEPFRLNILQIRDAKCRQHSELTKGFKNPGKKGRGSASRKSVRHAESRGDKGGSSGERGKQKNKDINTYRKIA
jgi:hypothetical protein